MKLYGSTTSPYVRRIRILLANTEHEFVDLNIYEGDDRKTMASQTPILRVPYLDDGGQRVFDSRVIQRYLSDQLDLAPLTWAEENQLTMIDAVNDAFVVLFQMKRSNIEADRDAMFVRLQRERIDASLRALNDQVSSGQFTQWTYPAICLYCLIDWIEFRHLHSMEHLDALKTFREEHVDRIEITATDPRH